MILTVTLNPAIDLTMELPRLRLGETNRSVKTTREGGGKGVNASHLLKRFRLDTEALVVLGGTSGTEYREIASTWKIPLHVIEIEAATRVNTVLTDLEHSQHTKIDQEGAKMSKKEISKLQRELRNLLPGAETVVFAGGMPPGFPVTAFRSMLRGAVRASSRVVVDTRGKALAAALRERVFLVKPNRRELEEAVGRPLRTRQALLREAQRIVASGPENLVVTLGERGAVWIGREGAWHARPPVESAQPTLGAGDSMTAGILLALERNKGLDEALRSGTAMACATVLAPGTTLAAPKEFRRLLGMTRVEPLE